MKVYFVYSQEKDVLCLLGKGKSSNNSQSPTKQYEQLVERFGDLPTAEEAATFVDEYINKNDIDVDKIITNFQEGWDSISKDFQKRAESILIFLSQLT
ncbi:MAG: hypothetical protein QG614_307 [Patescibacteria group bacterium]|nr:hypothetical protein [Patescibacteria group bacterium]